MANSIEEMLDENLGIEVEIVTVDWDEYACIMTVIEQN